MNLKEDAANTNWIALVLLVLIVGGLAFGIYWWQKQSAVETTPVELTPTATPITTTTPTETEDETADWKTYTNESFGLSFRYPESYSTEETTDIEGAGKIGGTLVFKDSSREGNPEMTLLFNPDGFGPGINDIYYCTKIENGKLKIVSTEESNTTDMRLEEDVNKKIILFDIGHYQAIEGFSNGIIVIFKYGKDGKDYEAELKKIIGTIEITKENIYGENDCL